MSRRIIIDELEFEVPYGKLAAKTWHEEDENSKRVLLLHGWMDNAGSYDNIAPHLKHKDGIYLVALDMPGHGKSSQLPPGSSYSDHCMVMEIRRCLTELEWIQPVPKSPRRSVNGDGIIARDLINSASSNSIGSMADDFEPRKKFTIIGHSLGAGIGLFYASLFPNDVENIIMLDFIKAQTRPIDDLLDIAAQAVDQFIETVPSQSPFSSPVLSKSNLSSSNSNKTVDRGQVIVSQETAIIATIEAHRQLGSLTREDATCLLKRSTVAVSTPPNCVIYSRDLRLQAMLNLRENYELHKVMFGRVLCNLLIVLGKSGMYESNMAFRDNMKEMEEYFKVRAKSVNLHWVEADHYLHMNKPKETAELINNFLASHD